MNKKAFPVSVFALIIFSCAAWAEDPLPISVAVQKAMEYSPYLKALNMGEKVAGEKIGQARAMKAAKFSIGVTDSHLDSPLMVFGSKLNQGRVAQSDFNPANLNDPGYLNNLQVGGQMLVPLFLGGMDTHGIKAAKAGSDAARFDTVKGREELIFRTIEAYLGAILARESRAVAEKACETSRESVRNAQAAVDAQRAVESDLLQAKVHQSENDETLLKMQNQYSLAQEGLATIMGVPSVASCDLNLPFLTQECVACGEDPQKLLGLALSQRPDYLKLEKQAQGAEHAGKMARGVTRPHVVLGAAAEQNRDGFDGKGKENFMGFARLEWNAGDGGESRHKAREADFQQQQVMEMRQSLADQIRLEIRQAIININNALERISVSRLAIGMGTESLRILRDRYTGGMAMMSDVLGAETSLLNHRMNHVRALYDYSISRAGLKMALGELNPEHCELIRTNQVIDLNTGLK